MKQPVKKTNKPREGIKDTGTPDPKKEYQAYLRSSWFKRVKEVVMERDNHRCQCCNTPDTERRMNVHHKCYDHIGDELNHLDDMILLCSVCHRAIHSAPANKGKFKRT